MKKLRLELDNLNVQSFATTDGETGTGTVEGYISLRCSQGDHTCNGGNTCDGVGDTCNPENSCYVSCAGSCPCDPDDPTFYASDCDTCYWTQCPGWNGC